MIHEVDGALRTLIEREALAGTDVEVVFDAPTKDWAARRTVPTVDVYLYDIREDLRRRERGLINSYDGDRITRRSLPPRHFKLSYLVTAWTQRPEDEHRLLASLLGCFLRYDALPPDLVDGPLAEPGLPVPLSIALPPPEDRSFADVWSALGGELKPSLDIVITAPTSTGRDYEAAPAVLGPAELSLGGFGEWPPRENRQGRPIPGRGTSSHTSSHTSSDAEAAEAAAAAEAATGTGRRRGAGRGAVRKGSAAGGDEGAAGSDEGAAAPTPTSAPTGMSWHQLGNVPPPPVQTSAEGAPPRRRGQGIKRKDQS